MSPTARLWTATLFLPLAMACGNSRSSGNGEGAGGDSPPASNEPSSADTAAEATKIFGTRCAPCHGVDGKGDGPTAKALNPRPRNFQDADWQSKNQDADIERIIQLGGSAVGKSPLMPPNPDLAGRPDLIKALRAHIRGLKGQ